MYNTGNEVPSSALEDMADNAQVFDGLVTKTSGTVTDRLGNVRRPFQQIVTDMGFNPVSGSFQAGATITEYNQCLVDTSTGTFYSWNGALPKVVADGSTPATAGGIGALLWVDRTDLMLRADINIVQKRFVCVADMVSDTSLTVGKIIETIGYYNGWAAVASTPIGGNRYEIVAAGTGTADAGAFINLSNGLQAKGLFTSDVCIAQFGAKIDGVTDDLTAIHSALSAMAYKRQVLIPDGTTCISDSIELPNGSDVVCDATIKLTALSWGGTVVAVYGKKDIRWNGGVIDGNYLEGQNGFSVAWYNSEAPSNVSVSDLLIKNCAWSVTRLGGKAVALHQGCTNVKFQNITSDDCSIGLSVEGLYVAEQLNRVSHGIHLSNFLIRRANRTAVWFYQSAALNIQNPNSYSAILDNIIIEDCTPMSGMGVISCDRANAVKLTATINNASNATAVKLVRGSMTNCNFDISAIVDNCSGAVDFAPHSGGGGYASMNNKLDIILNVLTRSSGYLVGYLQGYGLTATTLKIQYINFVGSGLFNNINSTVTFDLLRLSDGYRVAGNSIDGTIPSVVAAYHTYLMGNFATEGVLLVHSAANAVGIVRAAVSTEQLRFDSGAGDTMMQTIEPTVGKAALLIRNNNGSERLSQVTLGDTNSGGTGYKLLRVPN